MEFRNVLTHFKQAHYYIKRLKEADATTPENTNANNDEYTKWNKQATEACHKAMEAIYEVESMWHAIFKTLLYRTKL